jgi:membrane-bound lytic murein transglycosylase D
MRNKSMRTYRILGAALLVLALLGEDWARGGEEKDADQEISERHFPYPTALRPQVEFWKKIFATYSKFQSVIHDAESMKVYKVLDFRPLLDEEGLDEATVFQIKQDQTKIETERIRSLLLFLHQCNPNCEDLDADQKKIWNLYRNVKDPDKFLHAASDDRIRSQTGIKERFADAIRVSRRYLKAMEVIFRQEGVPIELTRLPFIESSFNVQAYSKVGAAGIWQFMPTTGRLFNLRINHLVDERRDPLIATQAAAQLLKSNYERLGSWPLAITAYNHGPGGLAAAVDATIIKNYKGERFGFASRNFYPEFLAAISVEKNFQDHFGPLLTESPLVHDEVTIDCPVPLRVAARFAKTDEEEMLLLNPALGEAVRDGRASVPHSYELRIPSGVLAGFLKAYEPWQDEERMRLAALERARKAKLAALRNAKRARVLASRAKGKRTVLRASTGKRSSVREARNEAKPKKRRG